MKNTHAEQSGLSALTLFVILVVTALWGFNFIVIKIGVQGVPPLFLAAMRFIFSTVPAVFFIKRPAVPWKLLAWYGLLLGVGEFGFLFTAIKLGAPSGMSSIILQSQAFFTALLAGAILKEKIRMSTIAGMTIAAIGLILIAREGTGQTLSGRNMLPVVMVILAAFFWAAANIVAQKMPQTNGLALTVWSSIFSPLPLLGLSLVFERTSILPALSSLRPVSVGALVYLVVLSTLFGYGAWNQLIIRHGAKNIAPFSLLVPVFGITASALVLHEQFTPRSAAAALLILAGLIIHVSGSRTKKTITSPAAGDNQ